MVVIYTAERSGPVSRYGVTFFTVRVPNAQQVGWAVL